MRVQRESRAAWVLAGVALFVIFSLLCFNDDLAKVGDSIFLYNRCYQIRDCLLNGHYPFLYYEDLGGIGYGSPIFYGQLSLFPFVFFLDDISVFLKVYFLSCLLLNFFGFRCFLKRVSSYATLTSCFYITSMAFLSLVGGNIPANVMAVGFSWFFFAFCVDYFRDGKSFALLILSYFMIWQSNFNSTVLATVVCFGIFLVYVNVRRWKDYVRLLVAVSLTIGYNLVNIVVHMDAISTTGAEAMLSVLNQKSDGRLLSIHPIGGYLFRSNFEAVDCCCGFMTLGLLAVFVYFVFHGIRAESRRFKVCSILIGVACLAGYAVGTCAVWPTVYKATDLFFQFPIRYYIFLFGFVLAILSRVIKPHWLVYLVIGLCILDIFAVNPFRSEPSAHIEYVGLQLGNGEYASPAFIKDYGVYKEYCDSIHSASGETYAFERGYNEVVVDCSSNPGKDILTLPKLYYKGYQAVGSDGELFTVESGYSNYCQVDIGTYKGTLSLFYKVPSIVMAFFWLQVACVLSCLWALAFPEGTNLGRGIRSGGLVCLFAIQLAFLWAYLQIRIVIFLWRRRTYEEAGGT